jgi:hypothetical protein
VTAWQSDIGRADFHHRLLVLSHGVGQTEAASATGGDVAGHADLPRSAAPASVPPSRDGRLLCCQNSSLGSRLNQGWRGDTTHIAQTTEPIRPLDCLICRGGAGLR